MNSLRSLTSAALAVGAFGHPMRISGQGLDRFGRSLRQCGLSINRGIVGNRPFEHGYIAARGTDHPGCTGKRRRRRNRHRNTTGVTP